MPAFLLIAQLTIAQPTLRPLIEFHCPAQVQIVAAATRVGPWQPGNQTTTYAPLAFSDLGGALRCFYGTREHVVASLNQPYPPTIAQCRAHDGGFSCTPTRRQVDPDPQ